MLFEIQALGGKVIASKSAMTTLNRLTTLLPNAKVNVETLTIPNEIESDEDDDIMHDPDIQEMVKNGEHTCHMFDAPCQACEDEEDEDEEDEDDITLAELKEQLEDNMTLAELQDRLLAEEEEEDEKEEEEEDEKEEEEKEPAPIEWVDEMTYYSRTCGELRNF